jgi:lipid II:glycine glycyltransferase (peptidoglycan interpeptide bridge formation enzyme)
MAISKMRALDPGYSSEVDAIDEANWCQVLQEFDDANLYQVWAYGLVRSGRQNLSHLILKRNGVIVSIAQARVAKLPLVNVGIAYVQWGPLWQRTGSEIDADAFRQAIRALRNEYVCRRGLVLRLFPLLYENESALFSAILTEEGFARVTEKARARTILFDLSPTLEELRKGMRKDSRRNLRIAEQHGLEIVEGQGDESFKAFIEMYKDMVARKNFMEPNDIHQFRSLQARLQGKLKMRILLCKSGNDLCAGVIWSALGNTGVGLFSATSKLGMDKRAGYLIQWKLVEALKEKHFLFYNLNGINPDRNPGGYDFKSGLAGKNGKDVYYMGRFDSRASMVNYFCVECGEKLRTIYRKFQELKNL